MLRVGDAGRLLVQVLKVVKESLLELSSTADSANDSVHEEYHEEYFIGLDYFSL